MLIWAGLGLAIVLTLLIVYTSRGNGLFASVPLPAAWLFMLPFGMTMVLLEGAQDLDWQGAINVEALIREIMRCIKDCNWPLSKVPRTLVTHAGLSLGLDRWESRSVRRGHSAA